MKILVVDDERNVRDSIGKFLKLEQMDVAGAENGLSAQRLLQKEVFSAAIIDVKMPGMGGLELIEAMRSRLKEAMPTVVVLTASGDPDDAGRAVDRGANHYLTKPVSSRDMTDLLRATETASWQ